jgi:site-specific recombinase XerC
MNKLLSDFHIYLTSIGISQVTIDNYLADLRYFIKWLALYLGAKNITLNDSYPYSIASHMSKNIIQEYKLSQIDLQTNQKTVNRRLSSLSKFCQFLINQKMLEINPVSDIERAGENKIKKDELESLINEFAQDLRSRKINPITIANYSVDIRQFINYIKKI